MRAAFASHPANGSHTPSFYPTMAMAAPVMYAAAAAVVSEASKQPLKTVDNENRHLGYDGGSTQVGTGTGSQGKPPSQGSSRCDDDANGAPFEPPCTLYLEDLRSFHFDLHRPLVAAYQALQRSDTDLCHALGKIFQQVEELVESTGNVVQTHGVLAQRIQHDVLPRLKSSMATQAETTGQESPVALVRWLINKMKNDTRVVRASYLGVLEAVQYVWTCTQIALDFYELEENKEQALYDEASWGGPSLLRCALNELRQVQNFLADPSDFWLVFHVTELELGRIESFTQHYSRTLDAKIAEPLKKAKAGANVCEALEQLSLHYPVPCGQY